MNRCINFTAEAVTVEGEKVSPSTLEKGVLPALGGYSKVFAALKEASEKEPVAIIAIVANHDFGDHAKATEVVLTPLWTALYGVGNGLPGRPNVQRLVNLMVLTVAEIEAKSRQNVVPFRRPDDAAAA